MQITEISELSKAKVKVFIDNEFAFVLYKGELRTYKIKTGEEISQTVYQQIMEEVLPKRAKLRCMNLLKSRDYTRFQLASKLRQGYYPQEVINQALDYVASYHYIDDARYAADYLRYALQTKSKKQAVLELRKKGIDTSVIEEAVFQYEEENEDKEAELIRKLLLKKKYMAETATREEKNKIVGFLYRKGFALDKIYTIIGEID